MVEVAAKNDVPVIIMHMRGDPRTMQNDPQYDNLIKEITQFLQKQISYAITNGINKKKIIIDPGIGFGKRIDDNFTLIRELKQFKELSYPVLVGPSRKSFIGKTLDLPIDQRVEGTAAVVTASILNGADIIRVHDVKAMGRVITISERIKGD